MFEGWKNDGQSYPILKKKMKIVPVCANDKFSYFGHNFFIKDGQTNAIVVL